MKKLLFLILLLVISCSKDKENDDENCIDESLIDNTSACIEIYDPVCGCDGITYDNYCVADSSGITSYVAGECCD